MFDLTLIHPKLVHFTIALFTMSVFFEMLVRRPKERYGKRPPG